MFASKVLITAGTPGHMYLEERQAKCLQRETTLSMLVNNTKKEILGNISDSATVGQAVSLM